jgi:hypothetical protein
LQASYAVAALEEQKLLFGCKLSGRILYGILLPFSALCHRSVAKNRIFGCYFWNLSATIQNAESTKNKVVEFTGISNQ